MKTSRAIFQIVFPKEQASFPKEVVHQLKWWNTHYKQMHQWENGRVEVKFDRNVKGFDKKDQHLTLDCPYCNQRCNFAKEAVDRVKGHIFCPFCKQAYGVHPNGQVFMVRQVTNKVAFIAVQQKEVMGWLQNNLTYLDAEVDTPRKGDDSVEVEVTYTDYGNGRTDGKFAEFVDMLEDSGYPFRRTQ